MRVAAHHPRQLIVAPATFACAAPCGFAVLASALPRPAPQVVMDDSPFPSRAFLWALPTRAVNMFPGTREKHVHRALLDKTPKEKPHYVRLFRLSRLFRA